MVAERVLTACLEAEVKLYHAAYEVTEFAAAITNYASRAQSLWCSRRRRWWAAGDPARQARAMAAVDEYLVRRADGLVLGKPRQAGKGEHDPIELLRIAFGKVDPAQARIHIAADINKLCPRASRLLALSATESS
jgi:hypothetical protein